MARSRPRGLGELEVEVSDVSEKVDEGLEKASWSGRLRWLSWLVRSTRSLGSCSGLVEASSSDVLV